MFTQLLSNKHLAMVAAVCLLATAPGTYAQDWQSLTPKTPTKLGVNPLKSKMNRTHATAGSQMRMAAASTDSPITEVPEGEHIQYTSQSLSFTSQGGLSYDHANGPIEIVYCDNGDVYFKDMITIGGFGTYVKGTYADGKITVKLPQVVYADDSEFSDYFSYSLSLIDLEYKETEDGLMVSFKHVDPEANVVTYTVSDDRSSLKLDLNPGLTLESATPPAQCVAYIDNYGDWSNFGTSVQELTRFEYDQVVMPDNLPIEYWTLSSSTASRMVNVAFTEDGKSIYIQNFTELYPEGCIKGSIEGDKVTFESPQYMGICEDYGLYVFMVAATIGEEDYSILPSLTFTYDVEAKQLALNSPDDYLVISSDADDIMSYYEMYENPTLTQIDPTKINAAPKTPEVGYYIPYQDEYGWGALTWSIPAVNVNEVMLDTSRMYWHFLVNGEVYEITTEEYPGVEEDMVDIPYDYSDEDWDIMAYGQDHDIYFHVADAESFGCQSFYIGDNDVVYASEVCTFDVSGVEEIAADDNAPVKAWFTDLLGRKVERPGQGIYILTEQLGDGSLRSSKIYRR